MKKIILILALLSAIAFSYCNYISKSGEYTNTNGNKICVYGKWHIPVKSFDQFYCPYHIEIDEQRKRVCDWN